MAEALHQAILINRETKTIIRKITEAGKAVAIILQKTNNIVKAI